MPVVVDVGGGSAALFVGAPDPETDALASTAVVGAGGSVGTGAGDPAHAIKNSGDSLT